MSGHHRGRTTSPRLRHRHVARDEPSPPQCRDAAVGARLARHATVAPARAGATPRDAHLAGWCPMKQSRKLGRYTRLANGRVLHLTSDAASRGAARQEPGALELTTHDDETA